MHLTHMPVGNFIQHLSHEVWGDFYIHGITWCSESFGFGISGLGMLNLRLTPLLIHQY